jgi:hypothetical protein
MPANIATRNGFTVQLVRSLRTAATGIVLPAGTVGRVLEYNPTTNRLMIDFGIANHAQALDPRSDAFQYVQGVQDEQ